MDSDQKSTSMNDRVKNYEANLVDQKRDSLSTARKRLNQLHAVNVADLSETQLAKHKKQENHFLWKWRSAAKMLLTDAPDDLKKSVNSILAQKSNLTDISVHPGLIAQAETYKKALDSQSLKPSK